MIKFLFVAACMTAIAAAAVIVPLLRDRRSRLLAAVTALLIVGAAAGLYSLWSTWNWNGQSGQEAAATNPEVAAMVAQLEQHMRDQPNDLQGWVMLGRSYAALNRWDDAIVAFGRAHTLSGGKDLESTIGYGEALAIKAGGQITPQAAQLFEEAIALAPTNPKALLYGGFAAALRGDSALARSRWQALKAQHPPVQVVQMLDQRIAELGPVSGGAAMAAAPGTPAAEAAVAAESAQAAPATAGAATAIVNIRIAPALKARLRADTPLFVFAREPGGRGPPLAAKRLTTAAIGTQIVLSGADSMIPGRALSSGQQVTITARVSFSGQPLPAPGDLYGELTYDVGRDGARDLTIDRVAQ